MAKAVPVLEQLLQAVVDHPQDEDRYLVLADWLEEHDDPRRAELLRLHRRLLATCCEPDKHPERAVWQARIVGLIAEGVRPCVPRKTVVLGEGVEMEFNFIPPGSFLMGSPPQEEGRRENEVQHQVTLTTGFWLGTHPVTKGQWRAVTRSGPGGQEQDNWPAEGVSWADCMTYCNRLSGKLGRLVCLPTEPEWEWACRAGTTTGYYTGDGPEALGRAGWPGYGMLWGSAEYTKPVGQFDPNAWGLYDLHGNVYEWCADWYGPYPETDTRDHRGPPSGNTRVLRGRSWQDGPGACRSAYRASAGPDYRAGRTGCRVVLCLDGQGP